jgi:hypothetical protein
MREECVEGFVVKAEGQTGYVEDVGVDGRIMVMRLTETEWKGVDWVNLAQDNGT